MHKKPRCLILCGIAATLLSPGYQSWAQDNTRPSSVGSRLERKFSFEQQDYNLKFGPVTFNLSDSLEIQGNDNINLSQTDKQSDIIITPGVNLRAFWPITPFNALSFNIGLVYENYLSHSDRNRFSQNTGISPDTDLNFDIFLGHFRINLHNRFSLTQDPVSEPSLSNVVSFGQFMNTSGLTITWDLNRMTALTFGYDHTFTVSTNSTFSFTDYQQDQLIFSTKHVLGRGLSAGVLGSAAITSYTSSERPNATSIQAGPYLDWAITPYTQFRVGGGFQGSYFDDSLSQNFQSNPNLTNSANFYLNPNVSGDNGNAYYANIVLSNRLSKRFEQTLSAGKETSLGITSQAVETAYTRYTSTWQISRRLSLNSLAFLDRGKQSGSFVAETFNRYGASVSTNIRLSRKLSTDFGYRFTHKSSDQPFQSYTQNLIYTGINYDF